MSLNILIAKKNSDVEKSDNQTSDRISPDGGYPSLGNEPETLFARNDLVKYSLIKRGHQVSVLSLATRQNLCMSFRGSK